MAAVVQLWWRLHPLPAALVKQIPRITFILTKTFFPVDIGIFPIYFLLLVIWFIFHIQQNELYPIAGWYTYCNFMCRYVQAHHNTHSDRTIAMNTCGNRVQFSGKHLVWVDSQV